MLAAYVLFAFLHTSVQATGHLPPAPGVEGAPFHLAVTPNLFAGDVSVLDTDTHTEVARIPVGTRPSRIAMSADGAFAYIGVEGGATMQIRKIDLGSLSIVGTTDLPTPNSSVFIELEVSPDGKWLVAGNMHMATVTLIDSSDMSIVASQSLCTDCNGSTGPLNAGVEATFTADSAYVWVAASYAETLSLITVPDGDIVDQAPAPRSYGSSPYGDLEIYRTFARMPLLNPTDSTLRIFEGFEESLDVEISVPWPNQDIAFADDLGLLGFSEIAFDAQPDVMAVLDLAHGTHLEISAPETWRNLEYHPGLQEMWVKSDQGVSILDMKNLVRGPDVPVGPSSPFLEMAFTPDGRFLYYPGTSDEVVVVDVATRALVTRIPTGDNPRGVFMQGDASTSSY